MTTTPTSEQLHADDVAAIDELRQAYQQLCDELGKVIVGQQAVIEQLAICLFARGHALLMGVPGLAKTLLIRRLAETLDLNFSRVQFTPDLMPMDITGTDILQESASGRREFEFVRGPLFANIVLADEINRAPSKTQAAMLEAMQEYRVTVVGRSYTLDEPFFVLATQNPIEQEGTYPLPEAQLDRFMFDIRISYPTPEDELEIAKTTTTDVEVKINTVLNGEEILNLQQIVRRLPISDHVGRYAVDLARATRPEDEIAPGFTKEYVTWGAGTRAVQYLVLGAKARAAISGQYNVTCDHVREVAPMVLRHRIMTNFHAEAEGISPDRIVDMLLEAVDEPKAEAYV